MLLFCCCHLQRWSNPSGLTGGQKRPETPWHPLTLTNLYRLTATRPTRPARPGPDAQPVCSFAVGGDFIMAKSPWSKLHRPAMGSLGARMPGPAYGLPRRCALWSRGLSWAYKLAFSLVRRQLVLADRIATYPDGPIATGHGPRATQFQAERHGTNQPPTPSSWRHGQPSIHMHDLCHSKPFNRTSTNRKPSCLRWPSSYRPIVVPFDGQEERQRRKLNYRLNEKNALCLSDWSSCGTKCLTTDNSDCYDCILLDNVSICVLIIALF